MERHITRRIHQTPSRRTVLHPAIVGEGHTSLNYTPTSYFPVIVRWLEEGLYIAGADVLYRDLIGARVEGIIRPDGEVIDLDLLEPVLNEVICVDHPNGHRVSHAEVLTNPHLMRGLGLADSSGLTYRLDLDGSTIEVHVLEASAEELEIVRIYDDAQVTPVSRSSGSGNRHVRTGENDSVLYVRYDDCRLDAFGFFRELLSEARRDEVTRLIIDLRQNSGGNSIPGTWFSIRLAGIDHLARPGGIFVLIGPRTFSSGMMLAVDLMDRTDAIFAGEPLAESPNSWGEVKRFTLPNSGLVIGHSTRFFSYAKGKDLRLDVDGNLVPDERFHIVPTLAYEAPE